MWNKAFQAKGERLPELRAAVSAVKGGTLVGGDLAVEHLAVEHLSMEHLAVEDSVGNWLAACQLRRAHAKSRRPALRGSERVRGMR